MLESKNTEKNAFIVRNKNTDILGKSTSGGFFYAICEYVISSGGVVVGAAIDDNMTVVHRSAKSLEECTSFLGSKYVQSILGNIYNEVGLYLKKGVLVCFSGTPCQVAGLKTYLSTNYDNLILVDLVCHGVLPDKMWKQYCEYQEQANCDVIKSASFRSKKYGYQNSMLNLNFGSHSYYGSSRIDPYLKTFYANIALRPSCYECQFKGIDKVSDFTIYDCWNAHVILGIKDDDAGYTNVIAHTERAVKIMEKLTGLEQYKVRINDILPSNGGMVANSAKRHPSMMEFKRLYIEEGFGNAFEKYLTITMKDILIEKMKIMLRRFTVFRSISKFKRGLARKLK